MRIWAVGGGKGGTGKSLIAQGLAAALAGREEPVILVDADYGAPNQHTLCGLRKPASALTQFFEDRTPLDQLALDTKVPGLRLVPGNVNCPDTDRITWAQKQKLFRHLRHLPAAHVVLDLGAGSQYDTLDTFLQADLQLAVILPDPLAIENFYLFLKNLKYRLLGGVLSRTGLKEPARDLWRRRADHGIATPRDLVRHLRNQSSLFAQALDQEEARLRPYVVLNQVREFSQVDVGRAVASAMRQYFGIEGAFAGYLRYDKDLWRQLGQDQPASALSSALHQGIAAVLDGILCGPAAA